MRPYESREFEDRPIPQLADATELSDIVRFEGVQVVLTGPSGSGKSTAKKRRITMKPPTKGSFVPPPVAPSHINTLLIIEADTEREQRASDQKDTDYTGKARPIFSRADLTSRIDAAGDDAFVYIFEGNRYFINLQDAKRARDQGINSVLLVRPPDAARDLTAALRSKGLAPHVAYLHVTPTEAERRMKEQGRWPVSEARRAEWAMSEKYMSIADTIIKTRKYLSKVPEVNAARAVDDTSRMLEQLVKTLQEHSTKKFETPAQLHLEYVRPMVEWLARTPNIQIDERIVRRYNGIMLHREYGEYDSSFVDFVRGASRLQVLARRKRNGVYSVDVQPEVFSQQRHIELGEQVIYQTFAAELLQLQIRERFGALPNLASHEEPFNQLPYSLTNRLPYSLTDVRPRSLKGYREPHALEIRITRQLS